MNQGNDNTSTQRSAAGDTTGSTLPACSPTSLCPSCQEGLSISKSNAAAWVCLALGAAASCYTGSDAPMQAAATGGLLTSTVNMVREDNMGKPEVDGLNAYKNKNGGVWE